MFEEDLEWREFDFWEFWLEDLELAADLDDFKEKFELLDEDRLWVDPGTPDVFSESSGFLVLLNLFLNLLDNWDSRFIFATALPDQKGASYHQLKQQSSEMIPDIAENK